MGLAKVSFPLPHLIDFRNGTDEITPGRISFRTDEVFLPFIVFLTQRNSPLSLFAVTSFSTSTFWDLAKPNAALVGFPFSSNAMRIGGPKFSVVRSFCFLSSPLTFAESLLGV